MGLCSIVKRFDLELMHKQKMYPPRFTLEVHGGNATDDTVALVEFEGACMDLSTEIYLSLPTTGTLHFSVIFIACVQIYKPQFRYLYYPSTIIILDLYGNTARLFYHCLG